MTDSLDKQRWQEEDAILALAVLIKEAGHSDERLAKIATPAQLKAARIIVRRWDQWDKENATSK